MMMEDDSDDDSVFTIQGVEHEIVEKFIRTFHNGEYDAEFDNTLRLDRTVIPSVRRTQASYNKPDNWLHRNGIGLGRVLGQLQNFIDLKMHGRNFRLNLLHNTNINQRLRNNEEPIVWHEPILQKYWGRLEAKIRNQENEDFTTTIERIQIENVEMKKESLAALVAIFRSGRVNNSSGHVTFNNTNLCSLGIVWLAKLVDASSHLDQLHLCHNRIDNMESARCLSRSVKSHSHIKQLHLNYCDLGSTPEILSVILQSDVKSINLSRNNIDSLGAVTIAEYLESNPPVKNIFLQHNRLNDDDAILISQALKSNTNLRSIHLYSNKITSIGAKALLNCVFDGSSLNAISDSNHTLKKLIMFSSRRSNIWLYYCIDGLPDGMLQLDRAQKIVVALQDKDSLLKYLANVPVELIPEVLAFPLRHVPLRNPFNQRQHEYLNIVYSTMRWWNMPMLYSYHNSVKSDTKRKRDK
jgi:hypothetical protein